MMPTAVGRSLTWLVPGLLVAVLGCGLGDYEEKLTEEQQRVDRFDKENKELADGPLEMPKLSEGQLDVFVRPPKGITLRFEERKYSDRFYRYSKKGTSDFSNVYLGWADKDKAKDFRTKVLSAFSGREPTSTKMTDPWGREGLTLDTVTGEETTRTYYIYLYPKDEHKVALIYEVPKQAKVSEALQASLNTLALDNDAVAQRKEFRKRRPAAKK